MMKSKTVSLILPCRNEEQALPSLFAHLPKIIDEVIIIDNGSTDNTVLIAKKYGAVVLTESKKRNGIGYGYALIKGILHATSDIIVCMDADGSYPLHVISQIVTLLLQKNYDFISCNRLPFQDERKMSKIRQTGVRILNLTTFFLFGKRIHDSLTGMWIFRKDIVPALMLSEGDWNFSLEIKLKALLYPSINFIEHHIPYQDRVFGASKQSIFKTGMQHMLYLGKLRLATLRERMQLSTFPLFSFKTGSK